MKKPYEIIFREETYAHAIVWAENDDEASDLGHSLEGDDFFRFTVESWLENVDELEESQITHHYPQFYK